MGSSGRPIMNGHLCHKGPKLCHPERIQSDSGPTGLEHELRLLGQRGQLLNSDVEGELLTSPMFQQVNPLLDILRGRNRGETSLA
jgi:hypothetical protein